MMRLGVVDFLNAFPLYYALEGQTNLTLVREVPSKLSELLLQGRLDAALISSVEYYKNKEHYSFHPNLCIAAEGAVQSIRLFPGPKTTLSQITTLKVDYASRSSLVMALLLCGPLQERPVPNLNLIYPPYETQLQNLKEGEALVLIGDPALKKRQLPSYDMGEEYLRLTGRSFVYALWVMPKSFPPDLLLLLSQAFETAIREKDKMQLAAARRFGFELAFTQIYLNHTIKYLLSDKLYQDMLWFFKQAEYHRLLPNSLAIT